MTTKQTTVENGMKEINAKLAMAALTAIIEMPTFKDSKIDFAPEGNDGMFEASFIKNERLGVDCYGNVSEQQTYEIELCSVLNGDELLTITVEEGECYIGDEKVELQNISAEAVNVMLMFKGGDGDQIEAACEEVAFSSELDALLMYDRLIAEWKTVYTTLMHGNITDDEKVDYIERYYEISDLVGQLRGTKKREVIA